MRYQGPIYRPPSEADSLLVQATLGCPHNKCAFCMVYKKGPRFAIRPLAEIEADLEEATRELAPRVRTLFLPSGNSLAMPTADLARLCRRARELLPALRRITTYASVPAMQAHGPEGLAELARAGLTRLHVGIESGHDPTLALMKKGCGSADQVRACRAALAAGLELNLYVMLGLAGPGLSLEHARATARALNQIGQAGAYVLRLRTLVPKVNTLLLHWIKRGRFTLCTPHQVLAEARALLADLEGPCQIFSDHYTNYLDLRGSLPAERKCLSELLEQALSLPRQAFRPDFVGDQ